MHAYLYHFLLSLSLSRLYKTATATTVWTAWLLCHVAN